MTPPPSLQSVVTCPWCDGLVVVEELRCGIFRHGAFRDTGLQIDPHATQAQIEQWAAEGRLVGCGRPFRVIHTSSPSSPGTPLVAERCGYI